MPYIFPPYLKGKTLKYPAIPEDASTVSHLYFTGSGHADTKSVTWTNTGSCPYVGRIGNRPPGIGPFSAGKYLSATTVGTFNFADGFTVYMVYTPLDSNSGVVFGNQSAWDTDGWVTFTLAGIGNRHSGRHPAGAQAFNSTSNILSGVNVAAIGRVAGVATTIYVKLNLDAVASNAAVLNTVPVSGTSKVGIAADAAFWPLNGYVHEIMATTTSWSDATVTANMNIIKKRLMIKTW